MVCKNCECAVWPGQIGSHLKGVGHRMRHKTAEEMQQTVQARMDVHQNPSEFDVVNGNVEKRVPQLKLHRGLQCMFDGSHCGYVCISTNNMNKHWSKQHRGARGKRGNGSNKRNGQEYVEWRTVACQRFFTQGRGSNYFRVEVEDEERERVPPSSEDAIARELQLLEESQKNIEKNRQKKIQGREEGSEFVPWLETMGWKAHLEGLDREDLLDSVADPDEEREPLVAVVWKGMEEMIEHCQWTTDKKVGYFIRMEAVRTEAAQTKYQPLQAYMDRASIVDHARPWKQMVAFFVCMQGRENEGPKYRLNEREKDAFEEMMDRTWMVHRKQE